MAGGANGRSRTAQEGCTISTPCMCTGMVVVVLGTLSLTMASWEFVVATFVGFAGVVLQQVVPPGKGRQRVIGSE